MTILKGKKKLLQINSVVNRGSTGRIAEEIGELAIETGWESYIAYGRESGVSKSHTIRIGNNFDIKLHGLQTRLFDNHAFASVRATKEFVSKIDDIKPDVVHLHNLHGYYINIEILINYLSSKDIPVVWTLHDCWAITGHCVHFDYIGCNKWKTACSNCPQKKSYPSSLFLDRSKQNFQLKKNLFNSIKNLTLVPVSNWLCDIINESYLAEYPIQVIYNGVDTNIFYPRNNSKILEKYNLENKFIILGVASIWNRRKGLRDFIKLSEELNDKYQIILVGLKQKQIKDLPNNIIGISHTNNVDELAELYSEVDVYINFSVEETFGMTTAEALSCGTPAIVYDKTACPEILSKETGFVIKKGDILELRKAIETIRVNGKNKYSDACIKRVNKLFNKNNRYLEYLNLYEKIINS